MTIDLSVYASRVGASPGGNAPWVFASIPNCIRSNDLDGGGIIPLSECGTPGYGATNTLGKVAGGVALGSQVVPGVGQLIGVFTSILGIFGANHARAVANERGTICNVVQGWKAFNAYVIPALQSGQLTLNDALAQLSQFHDAAVAQIAGIENAGQQNAGWGLHKILDACTLYNREVLYPSLVPGLVGNLTSPTGLALLGGAGLIGAKVIGLL